jgi:23S rRNA maturation mini-RNase III
MRDRHTKEKTEKINSAFEAVLGLIHIKGEEEGDETCD